MAFDKDKDVTIEEYQYDGGEGKGLKASINQYDGGELKFQLGPRFYTKKSGEVGYTKAGRLTVDELDWLIEITSKAKETISGGPSLDEEIAD